jgi:acetyltransferase-like isoleucine patch superfamily enzyme
MIRVLRTVGAITVAVLPWRLKRLVYVYIYRWDVSPSAHVGCSVLRCKMVVLKPHAHIGHFNLLRNCELVELGDNAVIGAFNWINGWPLSRTGLYREESERSPTFHLGRHSSITMMHIIDCTDAVRIGAFSTVAGCQSTIYTHSVDLVRSRQACAPINIGAYTFVGTNCTILPGAELPDYAVLGARSLLRSVLADRFTLYGGVPAVGIKTLSPELDYFHRQTGALWEDPIHPAGNRSPVGP